MVTLSRVEWVRIFSATENKTELPFGESSVLNAPFLVKLERFHVSDVCPVHEASPRTFLLLHKEHRLRTRIRGADKFHLFPV